MSNKDFAVQSTTNIPEPGKLLNKPKYLIILKYKSSDTRGSYYFLTLDKPEYGANIVSARGFFTQKSDSDEIKEKLSSILEEESNLYKNSNISEVVFPLNEVYMIKNLYFRVKQ